MEGVPYYQGGPLYCETLVSGSAGFPVEFLNTLTNAAPFLAAVFGTVALWRMRGTLYGGIWLLIALLYSTAIGSFFWHGFRDPVALSFDAIPGALFFMLFIALWFDALWGRVAGFLAPVGILAIEFLQFLLWSGGSDAFMQARAHLVLVVIGFFLVHVTFQRNATAGKWAALVMVGYSTAAAARTLDLPLCILVPFGTHWYWHIGLGIGAYAAIRLLMLFSRQSIRTSR